MVRIPRPQRMTQRAHHSFRIDCTLNRGSNSWGGDLTLASTPQFVNYEGLHRVEMEWLDIIEQRINDATSPAPAVVATPAD
jgi:hypothetical protein